MAIQVRGVDVLSQGEFVELMRAMPEGEGGSGVLQAMFFGEDVPPVEAHAALNIEARLLAEGENAKAIIERAVGRLRRAFPEELG
ncbi:MAG: hypothetical protein ACRDQW_17440 [Haloechinothrix sp.]